MHRTSDTTMMSYRKLQIVFNGPRLVSHRCSKYSNNPNELYQNSILQTLCTLQEQTDRYSHPTVIGFLFVPGMLYQHNNGQPTEIF